MFTFNSRYAVPMAAMLIWLVPVKGTDLDPKALTYKLPPQITWVENQTQSRIRDLLPPGSLGTNTALILTNAVYFKGEWKEPFYADFTQEDDFTSVDGRKVRVPMMYHLFISEKGARYAAYKGLTLHLKIDLGTVSRYRAKPAPTSPESCRGPLPGWRPAVCLAS